jgi:hypothetical protein
MLPALKRFPYNSTSRMLKKSASGVLATLRGSTYDIEYDSPLPSLRPCWTDILSILRWHFLVIFGMLVGAFPIAYNDFSGTR